MVNVLHKRYIIPSAIIVLKLQCLCRVQNIAREKERHIPAVKHFALSFSHTDLNGTINVS